MKYNTKITYVSYAKQPSMDTWWDISYVTFVIKIVDVVVAVVVVIYSNSLIFFLFLYIYIFLRIGETAALFMN